MIMPIIMNTVELAGQTNTADLLSAIYMKNIKKVIAPTMPLELVSLPDHLNGCYGGNRADTSAKIIQADNDLDAINVWLDEYKDSPQTYRNYRKEAERLLLWSIMKQRKPLSGLTREDFNAFKDFLADPQPAEQWCGPRASRHSQDWRPFQGPLKDSSLKQALVINNSLMNYLVEAGYLAGNPLALARRRVRTQSKSRESDIVERFLEEDLWESVLFYIQNLPQDTDREQAHFQRVRFLFSLLYLLGPRSSEIAEHTMGSFIEVRGKWWWEVTGKGRKTARIPVNDDMLSALAKYRRFHKLTKLPEPGETTPLILSLKGTSGITSNMIYRIVKDVVSKAANLLEEAEPHKAAKLRKASTHWFRHTAITHQADKGIELRYLKKSARHEKIDTTSRYMHAGDEQWHDAMQAHRLNKDK